MKRNSKTKAELQKDVNFLSGILGTISEGFVGIDRDLIVTCFNPAAEQMFQRTGKEVIGRDFFDVFPEAKHSMFLQKYQYAVENKVPTEFEFSFASEPRAGAYTFRLFPLEDNMSIYCRRGRKRQPEQSRTDNILFTETLLNAIPNPIFYKDAKSVYLGCNDAFETFTGLSRKNIIGRTVFEIAPRELAALYDAKDQELWKNPGQQVYEASVKLKNSEYREVVFYKSTFNDSAGRLCGIVGIILDITEQKQAERERESLRSHLLRAQKMQSIATLAGGVAHDFNNLLTVILGYSELLMQDTAQNNPAYQDLQKIHQTARSGADLVQKLLTFTNLTESQTKPLDINRQIEQLRQLLVKAMPKMVEPVFVLADDPGRIMADPAQIDQVIMDLAMNAVDAMSDGGTLTIKTRNVTFTEESRVTNSQALLGAYVALQVTDTGRGMDKQTLERIFDPFFTTKGRDYRKGRGLSLAMVFGIVHHLDGFIECRSEIGEGTSFEVYFPMLNESATENSISRKTDLRGTETVLIVDDDESILDLGSRILGRAGYTVLTAPEGQKALEIVKSARVDLVVLDLVMAGMSGKQCLKHLRLLSPDLKVLIATGYADLENKEELINAGARGIIKKPFMMRDLMKTVRSLLDDRKVNDA
jgi:two-component system, cell cycle sensor histidine kinase and response regulator CckA